MTESLDQPRLKRNQREREAEGPMEAVPQVCGVVMPISAIDDCSETHWTEVFQIVRDSVEAAGYQANIVSNSDESGIIQKRIVQNLFDNPVVICDVSGKNPNVMFELGLRLAFDKPTIVIKDDRTDYSFDTSPLEHVGYPRDLRFNKIVEFKEALTEKIRATAKAAKENPEYSTFLKHFGEFKIASIEQKEVGAQEYILEELKEMRMLMRRLQFDSKRDFSKLRMDSDGELDFCLADRSIDQIEMLKRAATNFVPSRRVSSRNVGDHIHLVVDCSDMSVAHSDRVRRLLKQELSNS